ncbi:MAG: DNA polymerase IV [Lentisphaeria bacterium]|nr:DNA polymerase IV [Lentisphaeria bacterium]
MRKILHIDMDAFFAAVEQRDRPELRGLPVIVGGAPRRRGVVSTCSYEARKYGVHSGMSSSRALALCREAIFIEPDFRKYRAASELIHQEFYRLTQLVEPVSIDEAYLDVSGICGDLAGAEECARQLQSRIFAVSGLTASAGVSYNKFLAKMASDFRKPAGLTVITPEAAVKFLDELPVEKFHGIGKKSAAKLRSINVKSGRDLRQLPQDTLLNIFGKPGLFYYGIVRGIDDRPVAPEGDPKSISNEITLYEDCSDMRRIRIILRVLSRKVFRRATARRMVGRSVFIKLKYHDFQTVTRTMPLPPEVNDGAALGEAAIKLLARTEAGTKPIRLAGVGIGQLIPLDEASIRQLEFEFPGR